MRFLYHGFRGWLNAPSRSKIVGKPALLPFKTHVFKTRAGIFDVDINMHLNNASLILACEFSRWNFIAGTDLLGAAIKNRWAFMVGSQAVRYRFEIGAFEKFEVHTDIIACDESWLWVRHVVNSKGRKSAHCLTRVIIKSGRDTVPPSKVLELCGVDSSTIPKPADSAEVAGFLAWDADVAQQMKK